MIALFLSVQGCHPSSINENAQGMEGGAHSPEDEIALSWANEDSSARELSRNFTTFPSSAELLSHIDRQVSPPNDPCPPGARESESENEGEDKSSSVDVELAPAAVGARRTLATYFQSCRAVDIVMNPRTPNLQGVQRSRSFGEHRGVQGGFLRKITNRQQYVDSHMVLSQLSEDSNYPKQRCQDMTERPPIFGFGSRPRPGQNGEINLFQGGGGVSPTSSPASGVDCSSFVSIAMANAGLRLSRGSGDVFQDTTTAGFRTLARQGNSCLDRPKMSAEKNLVSGDIINVSGNHMIMVDEVGDDPLAINRFAESGRCNDISHTDFDFTYIHSGAMRNGYGPSRVDASMRSSSVLFENLRLNAVQTCLAITRGESDVSQDDMQLSSRFDIIRHKSDDPECVAPRRNVLRGEECIRDCDNLGG